MSEPLTTDLIEVRTWADVQAAHNRNLTARLLRESANEIDRLRTELVAANETIRKLWEGVCEAISALKSEGIRHGVTDDLAALLPTDPNPAKEG